MTETLKGKTLFITGGSRGIGREIALRAAREGANVVIAAKTSEPHPKLPGTIHSTVAEIEALADTQETDEARPDQAFLTVSPPSWTRGRQGAQILMHVKARNAEP